MSSDKDARADRMPHGDAERARAYSRGGGTTQAATVQCRWSGFWQGFLLCDEDSQFPCFSLALRSHLVGWASEGSECLLAVKSNLRREVWQQLPV